MIDSVKYQLAQESNSGKGQWSTSTAIHRSHRFERSCDVEREDRATPEAETFGSIDSEGIFPSSSEAPFPERAGSGSWRKAPFLDWAVFRDSVAGSVAIMARRFRYA